MSEKRKGLASPAIQFPKKIKALHKGKGITCPGNEDRQENVANPAILGLSRLSSLLMLIHAAHWFNFQVKR